VPHLARGSAQINSVMQSAIRSIITDPRHDEHVTAVARLLSGKTAAAVAALEALVSRESQNADAWNDLAVARLEDSADDARSIGLSLSAADHALALRPQHIEALFNRALALDALGLRFASAEAWRRYLALDPGSMWANEARQRLAAADAPTRLQRWQQAEGNLDRALDRDDVAKVDEIVARFPLMARTAAETRFLPAWAAAHLARSSDVAVKKLRSARLIAGALKRYNGDALLYRTAIDPSDDVARGYIAYAQGRADNLARKFAECLGRFAEAERLFAAAGDPMELSAAYFRANALADLGRAEESQAIADDLEPRLDPSYRSLHAHFFWLRLRHATEAGRDYESLLSARTAREDFEQLGEVEYAARLRAAEAAMLARLGRDREAWQCRRLSLAEASETGRWNIIEVAIESIVADEIDGPNQNIVRSLIDVQIAAPSALPLMRFNGLLWRAFLDGQATKRVPDMAPARAAATHIPDAKQRQDAMDELRLAEAMASRETDPRATDALLTQVIDYRTRVGLAAFLPSILVQRAKVRRTLSKTDAAEHDLREAINLIETRRAHIRNDALRDAFLGRSEDAFEDLGELLLDRGDWIGAFEISERARARVLLDQAKRGPASAAEIVAAIPRDVVGAHFTSFRSRTLLIVLERERATHFVIDVDRSEVIALRDELSENPDSIPAARRLYDLLIAPIGDRLGKDRILVISPDESMLGIPFAALRDPSGHFLIEESAIVIAPAGAAIAQERARLQPNPKVTIVADPAFSPTLFPQLERLPAAHADTNVVTRMFTGTTIVTGEEATRHAFVSAAGDCDLLHVAAHAFSSPRDASLSMIVLTPENHDEGLLHLDEIESLALHRHPLVVLAGCQTASLGGGRGSVRSLAYAFLSAGSRAVLASLWNVEDQDASELTTRFYDGLITGKSCALALREAQLFAMRSRSAHDWAAFQLYVGMAGK